jgi:hypothetical protein
MTKLNSFAEKIIFLDIASTTPDRRVLCTLTVSGFPERKYLNTVWTAIEYRYLIRKDTPWPSLDRHWTNFFIVEVCK